MLSEKMQLVLVKNLQKWENKKILNLEALGFVWCFLRQMMGRFH